MQSQNGRLVLTHLIASGTRVRKGDLIATFDSTAQIDAGRDAQGKYDDLVHQVAQRLAENRASAARRADELRQAEATLKKAEMELAIGPVVAEITRLKDEVTARDGREHLASLAKSQAAHERAEAAALRILELQRDRQKVAIERTQANIQKLEIRAPLAGMAVLDFTYRGNAYGPAQVGDQIYRNYALASIFDPSEMQVRCAVNEADVGSLLSASGATVLLDAYPGLTLPAHFLYANPVAATALGTTIKTFEATFRIDRTDPRLLPDLSAAVALGRAPGEAAALVANGGRR